MVVADNQTVVVDSETRVVEHQVLVVQHQAVVVDHQTVPVQLWRYAIIVHLSRFIQLLHVFKIYETCTKPAEMRNCFVRCSTFKPTTIRVPYNTVVTGANPHGKCNIYTE